jgi:hypothetical protein
MHIIDLPLDMVNVPKANGITHYHHNNTASPSARRGEPSDDSDGGVSESGTFVKKTKIWVGDIRNVALGRKTTRSTRMRLVETTPSAIRVLNYD